MKRLFLLIWVFINAFLTCAQDSRAVLFDKDWRFKKENNIQAEAPGYNDKDWRRLDLPHDWSIEDLPNQIADSISGPFAKNSINGGATGFTVGETAWYRKRFQMAKSQQGKRVTLHFDGVYMNADVWLNGHHLGNHPFGYTPFYLDLTPHLKPSGGENVLAVRVRNEGKNSRWYSGSGIYRHVRLTVTEAVHVAPWGVYITTPDVSSTKAAVLANTLLNNSQTEPRRVTLTTTVISPDGRRVGRSQQSVLLKKNDTAAISQRMIVPKPVLWSVEAPRLYKAVTEIKHGNKILDRVETTFGIRSIRIDAVNGFLLNGKRVLLKGGSIHHDNGPIGAVALDRAEERKIEILKKNGFNAVRTSHNPPSQELLDACDRLGMLVIDEAFDMWELPKNPDDYHRYFKDWWKRDLTAMILRDRTHPSVIMWSIGNEIPERADSSSLHIARQMVAEAHRLDPTRPVTQALCSFWEPRNRGKQWGETAPVFSLLDVGGYNYLWRQYEPDHKQFPERIMVGSESFPREALENWNMVEKHPYVIGDFVWTAFDYMGEASIGHTRLDTGSAEQSVSSLGWPWYNAWCGDIDIIGNKKPQSYYRDVVWRRVPIAMAVHKPIPDGLKEQVSMWGWPDERQSWTWPGAENKHLQVRVFSRASLVRLLLNGKLVGEQNIADTTITAVFHVPYQAGVLKAVNVVNGNETDAVVLKTTGAPKSLRLTADRSSIKANRNDLSYVTVEVIDENNQVVPDAELPVQFTITGAGELMAVGNANPTDVSSFQQGEKKTFRGTCLAIVRPLEKGGNIILKASAQGLPTAEVVITTR